MPLRGPQIPRILSHFWFSRWKARTTLTIANYRLDLEIPGRHRTVLSRPRFQAGAFASFGWPAPSFTRCKNCPFSSAERSLIVEIIDAEHRKGSFWLFGYVVMPDHLHLLLSPAGQDVPRVMRDIKSHAGLELMKSRRFQCEGLTSDEVSYTVMPNGVAAGPGSVDTSTTLFAAFTISGTNWNTFIRIRSRLDWQNGPRIGCGPVMLRMRNAASPRLLWTRLIFPSTAMHCSGRRPGASSDLVLLFL